MARITVKIGLEPEIHAAGEKLLQERNLSWVSILSNAIIKEAAIEIKNQRQQMTTDQIVLYNEAMGVLVKKITDQINGKPIPHEPSFYAKVHAKNLANSGYFTNSMELLDDARKLIAEKKTI